MFRLPVATLVYAVVIQYAYMEYINPVFGYAHYLYFEPSVISLLFTYGLVVAPAVAYRASLAPAAYGAALIFALCYVPAQFVLLFNWQRAEGELALVQASVAASMAILLRVSTMGGNAADVPFRANRRLSATLGVLTIVAIVVFVLNYYQDMRLVSFEDVYDLRFETNQVDRGAFVNYLTMWLSYCFLPFYFARGVLRKKPIDLGIGLVGSLLIYAAMGSKAAILMGFIIYALHLFFRSGENFLFRLLAALVVAVTLIVSLFPDEGPLLWVKSILLVRVLGTSGWTISTYYDYFTTNGFTFYTHIGPINAVTGAYPYGEYSLGQIIGLQYGGSAEANYNANFWASDGFAALGVAGVPVVTTVVCAVFYLINRAAKGYSTHFVVLWLSGFWLALLNLPLTVALLSGGGLLTVFLLWIASPIHRYHQLKQKFIHIQKSGSFSKITLSRSSPRI
jgi:hypothetical protein